jgi:hypothetical protein
VEEQPDHVDLLLQNLPPSPITSSHEAFLKSQALSSSSSRRKQEAATSVAVVAEGSRKKEQNGGERSSSLSTAKSRFPHTRTPKKLVEISIPKRGLVLDRSSIGTGSSRSRQGQYKAVQTQTPAQKAGGGGGRRDVIRENIYLAKFPLRQRSTSRELGARKAVTERQNPSRSSSLSVRARPLDTVTSKFEVGLRAALARRSKK